nr:RNA-directed DNA polymerase, eukaryota [Tanacetum cinerariifolium]
MESMGLCSVKTCGGNFAFDYVRSDSVGNSGGILCVWDPNSFRRSNTTILDYFIMIRGVWLKSGVNLLILTAYTPYDLRDKRMLWDYFEHVINQWDGEVVTMGDFNDSEAPGDDSSAMRSMMRKLKYLKVKIQEWNNGNRNNTKRAIEKYKEELDALDAAIDKGYGSDDIVNKRIEMDLERDVSKEELKRAVWDCGTDKSPSLDGPTEEIQFFKGLKQGDLLSPFLLILIIESLHLSFQRVVDAGMFMGIKLSPSLNLSHMFYADDVVFVGQWCDVNINTLVHVLECIYRVLGLRIIMSKSKVMGVHVKDKKVKS